MENDRSDGHCHSKNPQNYPGYGYFSTPRYENNNKVSPPVCLRCGNKHKCRFLTGRYGCYRCCENGNMIKVFPKAKVNGREGKKVSTNQVEYSPPKRNRFYDLQSKGV